MAAKTFSGVREAGFWWVMTVLSVLIGAYALTLAATGFRFVPESVTANPAAFPVGLPIHIVAAALALILGPLQFRRGIRARAPKIHRWLGRGYVAACTIGGVAGGSIALTSDAGPIAGWGFFLLAVAWLGATLMAWRCALKRDFAAHERWMVRSFALTFAAVTLRLYLPLGALTGGDFYDAYRVIAWAAWVPNLAAAELWLWAKRGRALASIIQEASQLP